MHLFRALLFISFFLTSVHSFSNGVCMGGELTWKCVKSGPAEGKFVFYMTKYYRCAPHYHGGSITIYNGLYSNFGGPATINIPYNSCIINSLDTCWSALSSVVCPPFLDGPLIMAQYNFTSDTITLTGVPDTSGTEFYVTGSLGLNSRLYNYGTITGPLMNIASANYYWRAVMYPYKDPRTNQYMNVHPSQGGCYDSSPKFAEVPVKIHCISRSNKLLYSAVDQDGDSLVYELTTPQTYSGLPTPFGVTYYSGYSYTSPLPNSSIYSSNVGAVLNTLTGEMTFKVDSPAGYFTTAVKVTSYKNHHKVSEIYRDLDIWLWNCPAALPSTKPNISYRKKGQVTYSPNYHDTLYLGERLEMDIRATDSGFISVSPLIFQAPNLKITGVSVAPPNDSTNCLNPPCGYLDSIGNAAWDGIEFRQDRATTANFSWQTDCSHLDGAINYLGHYKTKTFTFYVFSNDQVCPVPDNNSSSFTITLIDTNSMVWPIQLLEVDDNYMNVSWAPKSSTSFNNYKVFRKGTSAASWNLRTTITNPSSNFYQDTLDSGYTAPLSYKIDLGNPVNCYDFGLYRSIFLSTTTLQDTVSLSWNSPYFTLIPNNLKFYIERKDALNNWIRLDSANQSAISYYDASPVKGQWNEYRIVSNDDWNLTAISNLDSVFICDSLAFQDSVTICAGDTIFLHGANRTSAGVYSANYQDRMGCDSTMISVLTLDSINAGITWNYPLLSSTVSSASYQWYNCDSNIAIPGANAQFYQPLKNGKYAVLTTKGACSVLSDCLDIIIIGTDEYNGHLIKVYPNPVSNNLMIEGISSNCSLSIFNSNGQIVMNAYLEGTRQLNVSELNNGVHYIEISIEEKVVKRLRFIKE